MNKTRRLLSVFLVLIMLCGIMIITATAVTTTAFDILSGSHYAKTYTLSASGKTIPYTNNTLTTRGTVTYGASAKSYIANSTDEIYIFDVGCTNGKYWVYCSYPTSSGRVKAYIPLSAISTSNIDHTKSVSTGKFYCSLRLNSAVSRKYYVAKNDPVYLIAVSGGKCQIMYPIGSGDKYRIAWCSSSDYNKYCVSDKSNDNLVVPSSDEWQWPMRGYRITQDYNVYNSKRAVAGRPYHCGIDMVSSNTDIYAAQTGMVVYKGYSSGNGYHVVLSHDLNGVTVKTLYSHLSSYSSCPAVGQTVQKGAKIGIMGNTGNSSGAHLHFSIYTGNSNDPWGYTSSGGANKISYRGCVFFDPTYVITNGKLP